MNHRKLQNLVYTDSNQGKKLNMSFVSVNNSVISVSSLAEMSVCSVIENVIDSLKRCYWKLLKMKFRGWL